MRWWTGRLWVWGVLEVGLVDGIALILKFLWVDRQALAKAPLNPSVPVVFYLVVCSPGQLHRKKHHRHESEK